MFPFIDDKQPVPFRAMSMKNQETSSKIQVVYCAEGFLLSRIKWSSIPRNLTKYDTVTVLHSCDAMDAPILLAKVVEYWARENVKENS